MGGGGRSRGRRFSRARGVLGWFKGLVMKHPMIMIGLFGILILIAIAVLKFTKANGTKPVDFVKENLKKKGTK
jgi:hypothetical protein